MKMRIGSVFAGIGGLELGLERAGVGYVVWQIESNPLCRHVLGRHWPDALRYDDVAVVGARTLAAVDVVCGGFPCQDISADGKRAGIEAPRSGLWRQLDRIVHELRPRWVVVENIHHTWRAWVPVLREALHARGYASVPILVRASDVGAAHERARVFLVAGTEEGVRAVVAELDADPPTAPDDAGVGLALRVHEREDGGEEQPAARRGAGVYVSPGFGLPPEPWMVRGVHGVPGGLDGPWAAAGWTGARLRAARVHMLGNAVVPACSAVIGDLIVRASRSLEVAA